MTDRIKKIPELLEQPGPSWRDALARLSWDDFCTVSLRNWIDAAARAGLQYVPAREIWRGPIASLLRFDQEGTHQYDLESMQQMIEWARVPQTMVRWDCCAGYDVKGELGNGRPEWQIDFTRLYIDDPRAFDLIYEYPRDEMIVWSRPWIKAKIIDGYPVEFRTFIKDGAVIGVASYYPQRPLSEDYRPIAEHARHLTERLITAIRPLVWIPPDGGRDRWRKDAVHGTADWLLTETGELLFLEGGPPFGAGAHPCCFIECDEISGVALASKLSREELY